MKDFIWINMSFFPIQDDTTVKILKIYFTISEYSQKIQRTYIKIQKVAVDIGGVIKFFSLIFTFV